jgi:general secretion pathway protein I
MFLMRRLRRWRADEAGVTLLEVLIAISLLAISFTAVFSGLSSALRTTDQLAGYDRSVEYATRKLNDLVMDPTLGPGEERSGVSGSGISWRATTDLVDKRPSFDPDQPVQLIRIRLETSWAAPAGRRSFVLQTLKLRLPEVVPHI